MYVGVDGCPGGWIAVAYADGGFEGARFYSAVEELWDAHADADRILIDVPIGLREESAEPRNCDAAARELLSPRRHASVFPTPVRAAAREDTYEAAKATQESLTEGSLSRQTWGIAPKIDAVDRFLLETEAARGRIRESHPEVCFCGFAGEPTRHSKTGEPERAVGERVRILERVEPRVRDHLGGVPSTLGGRASEDDLLDAFAVALAARGDEEELRTLPAEVEHDPRGLPMEIVYRVPER